MAEAILIPQSEPDYRAGHIYVRAALRVFLAVFLTLAAAQPLAAQSDAPQAAPLSASDAVQTAWGFDQSNLTPDPAIRYGVLSNGMRYALRHNEKPEDTAVFELAFDIGSFAEADDERGLAHFIEHMAFNGTTNVPEGEMVKILERFGLAFGADTNAYTTFDRTGYTLDLPNTSEELIDTSLFLLRETASEILFDPAAVDRERGVVLSEMRTRDYYGLRNFVERTAFLLPKARIAERMPIGTEAIINDAPAERLKRFYQRYYAPNKATLVIVGNIDVDAMERKIIETFADWEAADTQAEEPVYGTVDYARPGAVNAFVDPAIGESAMIVAYGAYRKRADNLSTRRQSLLQSIGYRIIARRIGRLIRSGDAPFLSANFGSSDVFEKAKETQLYVQTRDGDLALGVAAAEKIIRQALTHGFTQQEIDEQIAGYRNGLGNAVNGAETRRNSELANQIIDAAFGDRLVTTPQARLARFEAAAPDITPQIVLEALREDLIDLSDPLIHVTAKSTSMADAEAVRTAYLMSRTVAVSPPEDEDNIQFAYTDFGPSGTIVSDTVIADLGIRTIRFANNVRLNLKPTQFEQDRVRISLRINGGELLNTLENPYATTLMRIYGDAGLEAHSVDDLLSILAGRSVLLGLSAGSDYFGNYVATTPQDTLLQFQLLAAYMTAPGYRQEALARYRQGFDNYYAQLEATTGAALGSHIGAIISDNDPRFSLAPQEILESLDFADLHGAIGTVLADAPLEIGVVGDINPQRIIDEVARTFGALPMRQSAAQDNKAARQRSFTSARKTHYIAHDGEPNQTVLRYYWPTSDDADYAAEVRLSVLTQILQLRLTDLVREKIGASYSPSASSFMSSIYEGFGYISVGSNVDFADRAITRQAIEDIIASLIAEPASEDEVLRATKPIVERLKQRSTSNGSWLAIVDAAQTDPEAIARYHALPDLIEQITAAALQQEATQWLSKKPLIVEVVHRAEHAKLTQTHAVAEEGETSSALGAITADDAEEK